MKMADSFPVTIGNRSNSSYNCVLDADFRFDSTLIDMEFWKTILTRERERERQTDRKTDRQKLRDGKSEGRSRRQDLRASPRPRSNWPANMEYELCWTSYDLPLRGIIHGIQAPVRFDPTRLELIQDRTGERVSPLRWPDFRVWWFTGLVITNYSNQQSNQAKRFRKFPKWNKNFIERIYDLNLGRLLIRFEWNFLGK